MKILLIIAIIMAVCFIGWVALAFIPQNIGADMPEASKATHSFYFESSGGMVLSSDYEKIGNKYILHGYWEMRGNKFKFIDNDIILDQDIFGEITVERRKSDE